MASPRSRWRWHLTPTDDDGHGTQHPTTGTVALLFVLNTLLAGVWLQVGPRGPAAGIMTRVVMLMLFPTVWFTLLHLWEAPKTWRLIAGILPAILTGMGWLLAPRA
jgi:hypothetical protein